jgi:hypothetical protein
MLLKDLNFLLELVLNILQFPEKPELFQVEKLKELGLLHNFEQD